MYASDNEDRQGGGRFRGPSCGQNVAWSEQEVRDADCGVWAKKNLACIFKAGEILTGVVGEDRILERSR